MSNAERARRLLTMVANHGDRVLRFYVSPATVPYCDCDKCRMSPPSGRQS